jgi:hypothetical protein
MMKMGKSIRADVSKMLVCKGERMCSPSQRVEEDEEDGRWQLAGCSN